MRTHGCHHVNVLMYSHVVQPQCGCKDESLNTNRLLMYVIPGVQCMLSAIFKTLSLSISQTALYFFYYK